MNSVVRFVHPIARRSVTRTLCATHVTAVIASADRLALAEPAELSKSLSDCEWCRCSNLRFADLLRERVSRECTASLVEVSA